MISMPSSMLLFFRHSNFMTGLPQLQKHASIARTVHLRIIYNQRNTPTVSIIEALKSEQLQQNQ